MAGDAMAPATARHGSGLWHPAATAADEPLRQQLAQAQCQELPAGDVLLATLRPLPASRTDLYTVEIL